MNVLNWLKKELVLKLDFVNNEFEIGWIWIILLIPKAYVGAKMLVKDISDLIKNIIS